MIQAELLDEPFQTHTHTTHKVSPFHRSEGCQLSSLTISGRATIIIALHRIHATQNVKATNQTIVRNPSKVIKKYLSDHENMHGVISSTLRDRERAVSIYFQVYNFQILPPTRV